jgi:hypothetical protein
LCRFLLHLFGFTCLLIFMFLLLFFYFPHFYLFIWRASSPKNILKFFSKFFEKWGIIYGFRRKRCIGLLEKSGSKRSNNSLEFPLYPWTQKAPALGCGAFTTVRYREGAGGPDLQRHNHMSQSTGPFICPARAPFSCATVEQWQTLAVT